MGTWLIACSNKDPHPEHKWKVLEQIGGGVPGVSWQDARCVGVEDDTPKPQPYRFDLRTRLLEIDQSIVVDLYLNLVKQLATPPEGWFTFGPHPEIPEGTPLEWWGTDDGGLPIWERPAS